MNTCKFCDLTARDRFITEKCVDAEKRHIVLVKISDISFNNCYSVRTGEYFTILSAEDVIRVS